MEKPFCIKIVFLVHTRKQERKLIVIHNTGIREKKEPMPIYYYLIVDPCMVLIYEQKYMARIYLGIMIVGGMCDNLKKLVFQDLNFT